MNPITFEKYADDEITGSLLQEASQLFSNHYGVWGHGATEVIGPSAIPGTRIRMSASRLRTQSVPPRTSTGSKTTLIRTLINSDSKPSILAGHVFATRWRFPTNSTESERESESESESSFSPESKSSSTKSVLWITQLVVHREYRERGLASMMLSVLRDYDDEDNDAGGADCYGILSSHPAAILAAEKAFGHISPPSFLLTHIRAILSASPINYIANARLRGRYFNSTDSEDALGRVCCADTGFFVDRGEPLEALARVRARDGREWRLGELVGGHEFLMVTEGERR